MISTVFLGKLGHHVVPADDLFATNAYDRRIG